MAGQVAHLRGAAAREGKALLQLNAWQPVVNHHLPPGPMLVELKGVQPQGCMLITDDKVEQQVLLGCHSCQCS